MNNRRCLDCNNVLVKGKVSYFCTQCNTEYKLVNGKLKAVIGGIYDD